MALFALLRHQLFFRSVELDANALADIVDVVYLPLIEVVSGSPTHPVPVV